MTKTIAVDSAEAERKSVAAFMQLPGAKIVSRERHAEASAVVITGLAGNYEFRIIRMINNSSVPTDFVPQDDGDCATYVPQKSGMPFPGALDYWPDENDCNE